MLPKPVTALALSALVSFASSTALAATAAPTASSDITVTVASSQVKGSHHGKADSKKAVANKKKAHLASLHGVEPKSSPKQTPKLAVSLTTRLDLKKAQEKAPHATATKKPTLAATGKEVFIGGPTGHKAVAKTDVVVKTDVVARTDKVDKPVLEGTLTVGKVTGKVAVGPLQGSKGPTAKSGRAPSRPASATPRTDDSDQGTDEHPVSATVRVSTKVAAPKGPCLHEPIDFVRGAETDRFPVTQCDGVVAPLAVERFSVLVRSESAVRPESVTDLAKVKDAQIAPGIRRVDPGLLARLQLIADHFAKPGVAQRISIISGYRPGSTGSFHASAQALDFHLEGVPNEALVDFCKALDNTGCGYYPNSSFVHVDVRPQGTGHVAWIDASAPGEPPRYVASWPPPPEPDVKVADIDAADPYAQSLPPLPGDARAKEPEKAPAASINTQLKLKEWE